MPRRPFAALRAWPVVLLLVMAGGRAAGQTVIQATPVPTPTPLTPIATPTLAPAISIPTSAPATPMPTPTSTAPADGSFVGVHLLLETPNSRYYEITYWSSGLRINGYLGKPKGRGPFPAIIYNRGGNRDVGKLTGGEIVPFVEAGYVTVASQYRGGGGSEGMEQFGGADLYDVTNLIILLKRQPEVDDNRIGMFGGSRGGMMTYLALKYDTLNGTHDIKAAVTVGGIADLLLWNQQRPDLVNSLYVPLIGVSPAQDRQPYEDRSALYWPDLINAPILLLHGGADREVWSQHSEKLAEALQQAGKTVSIVVYPGDDHPLSQHQYGYPAALDWFQYYLGGDGVDRTYAAHQQAIADVQTWFQDRAQRGS